MANDQSGEASGKSMASTGDTFSLIGNETRATIVQILGDALAPEDRETKLTLMEIRSRITQEIDPERVEHHLQELVGPFVKKTDEGYQLRPEGIHLYWTLQAGVFERSREGITVSAAFDCFYCQTTVEATSFKGIIKVECPECEFNYLTDIVEPPLETFDDESAAFTHFSKYFRYKVLGWADGICSLCGNTVSSKFVSPDEKPGWGERRAKVYVYLSCDHCREWVYLTVGMALLGDPQVVSFCYAHGVDVLSTPVWELEFATTDQSVSINSRDPWEVALRVTYDDDVLEVVLDESVSVVARNPT